MIDRYNKINETMSDSESSIDSDYEYSDDSDSYEDDEEDTSSFPYIVSIRDRYLYFSKPVECMQCFREIEDPLHNCSTEGNGEVIIQNNLNAHQKLLKLEGKFLNIPSVLFIDGKEFYKGFFCLVTCDWRRVPVNKFIQ